MGRRRSVVVAVVVPAWVMMGLALAGLDPWALRVALALTLVLALPGFALSLALFPDGTLEPAERAAFSLGTSLATTALGGLLLHWSSAGLHAGTWAVLLGGAATLASGASLLRGASRDSTPAAGTAVVPSCPRLTFAQGSLFLLGGLIAAGAIGVARRGEATQDAPAFTRLWMLPGEDGASVRLGVQSHESVTATYRLVVDAGGSGIREEPSLTLAPGAHWNGTITLPSGAAGAVTARLYRRYVPDKECSGADPPAKCRSNTEVYRQVQLRRGSQR